MYINIQEFGSLSRYQTIQTAPGGPFFAFDGDAYPNSVILVLG